MLKFELLPLWHSEGCAALEEASELLNTLIERVTLASDLNRLDLLQGRKLLPPVEHLLLETL